MTDKNNKIVKIFKNLKPNRIILPQKNVYYTYELPVGVSNFYKVNDILEIKKPDGIKVVSTTEYRNNYVASRDLEGAIVQIEKYIYILNHEGEARVKKIQDKVRNHLPSNFRLKVVNPQGILLLGRSNNLTDEQLFDFEIIKRQHKNIVDIMTYDDLLKRFRNILNQIK